MCFGTLMAPTEIQCNMRHSNSQIVHIHILHDIAIFIVSPRVSLSHAHRLINTCKVDRHAGSGQLGGVSYGVAAEDVRLI